MPRRLFFTKPRLVVAFGLALLAGAACSAGADLNISSCAAIRAHIREYSDIGDGSDFYVWWRDGSVYWTDDIGDSRTSRTLAGRASTGLRTKGADGRRRPRARPRLVGTQDAVARCCLHIARALLRPLCRGH